MDKFEREKISKLLSYILRHKPDSIGIELDKNGWADINQLITKINISEALYTLDYQKLKIVVDTNEKNGLLSLMMDQKAGVSRPFHRS